MPLSSTHPEGLEESSVGLVGHGDGRRGLDDAKAEGLGPGGVDVALAELGRMRVQPDHEQGVHLLRAACNLVEETMARLGGEASHPLRVAEAVRCVVVVGRLLSPLCP